MEYRRGQMVTVFWRGQYWLGTILLDHGDGYVTVWCEVKGMADTVRKDCIRAV